MWQLEPGPIAREDMPLPPAIFYPGRLAGHLDLIVGELGASDVVLGGHQVDIAGNNGDGLDALYARTIGAAADADANQPRADADQTAHGLVDAGEGTEAYRQSVLRYLPPPETAVPENFTARPPEPGNYPEKPPPDLVDIIQNVDNLQGRVTALEHGTKIIVPPQPGAPPPAGPPAAPTHAPPGVEHLPSYGEVNDAYLQFLGGPASFAEYLEFWSMRTDWYMGIATSGEAEDYRRTGISRR